MYIFKEIFFLFLVCVCFSCFLLVFGIFLVVLRVTKGAFWELRD